MAMCLKRPEDDEIADPLRGVQRLRRLAGMAIAAVVVVSSMPAARAADVEAVRLWRAPDHTRVVLDLSGLAEFNTLSLANPDRFVVDLASSQLGTSLKPLPLERDADRQLRSGIRKGTDLRLVFDLVQRCGPRFFVCRRTRRRVSGGDRFIR